MPRTWVSGALLALAVSWSSSALAQASASDQAAAQALFDEGKALISSGRPAEACPKFEESQRLDPGLGTQLNLADCYERVGRTASAWTLYVEVALVARREGQDVRAQHADARAAALKPTLSKLTIMVPPESRVPGLNVTRDTALVREAQWGLAVPVDPGQHTIAVSAPGKEVWQTTIEVQSGGVTRTITVPTLKDAAGAPAKVAAEPQAPPSHDRGSPDQDAGKAQRIGGLVAMGVGVVGVGVGTFFGLSAMSKKSDAGCDGSECADEESLALYEDAQSAGTVSTIGFILGGVGLAGGAVLYFTAPRASSREQGLTAQATFGPGFVQLGAGGRF